MAKEKLSATSWNLKTKKKKPFSEIAYSVRPYAGHHLFVQGAECPVRRIRPQHRQNECPQERYIVSEFKTILIRNFNFFRRVARIIISFGSNLTNNSKGLSLCVYTGSAASCRRLSSSSLACWTMSLYDGGGDSDLRRAAASGRSSGFTTES